MELMDSERFKEADKMKPTPKDSSLITLSEDDFDRMLKAMGNPVEAQKEVAVKIKAFLDHRMSQELSEKGFLSDHTRRWVRDYNVILENIQKALFGDKSVNLHLHKVTHSQIAAKIREVD